MEKIAKQKWLKALRSGRYKQAIGRLQVTRNYKDTFCCLGVLCKTQKVKNDIIESSFGLPNDVRMNVSLSEKDCLILTTLNDEEKKSFKEIANWIEVSL